ncbi:hypothetical protein ElyMa_006367700 [Elysia marginata]|uniref:Uncharacterized protein n=1 Tax=Elysia marginata TaxID=1093978 RepID=A0AAV4HNL0_9GAST|nr:hypothetical protein ElyMa_006367700 [Elysia marginata]
MLIQWNPDKVNTSGPKKSVDFKRDLQIARKTATDEPDNEEISQAVTNFHHRLDDLAQEINETLEDLKFESEDLYAQEIDDETLR